MLRWLRISSWWSPDSYSLVTSAMPSGLRPCLPDFDSAGHSLQSVRLQAKLQKLNDFRGRVGLSLWRDVLGDHVGRTFQQDAKNHVGISLARADHADYLGEDVCRVGPILGDALDATDQRLDGGEGTICHGAQHAGLSGGEASGFASGRS